MKFRCRMIDTVAMRDFTNVTNTVSRMSKLCVLRLTANEICFMVADDQSPVVWAQLTQKQFFSEYAMNGVSDDQNEIYLEFEPVMLAKSLSSLKMTAKSVKIKLTNKQQPCLTIELELPSLSTESRQCVHDVPVRVIPRREWGEFQAPNIPEFDISIEMPQLKHVRNVVERMKTMSPHIMVTANTSGKLILRIDSDFASVATHFQGLQAEGGSQTQDEEISASIDIRKFGTFLAWDIIHPENVKCNILHERMVNMFLKIEGHMQIHYFIPAIAS